MLREFSLRRIIAFFFLDWLGTALMLFAAGILRSQMVSLLERVLNILGILKVETASGLVSIPLESVLQTQVVLLVLVLWPFFFIVFSVYDGKHNETLKAELLNVFLATCVSIVTLAGFLFLTYRETSRVLFMVFFMMDLLLLLGARVILWAFRMLQRANGYKPGPRRVVLVVGAGPVGRSAVCKLHQYAQTDLDLIGFLDDDLQKQRALIEGLPVLGTLDEVARIVQDFTVQDAVIALPLRAHKRLVEICNRLQKLSVRVHVIPDLFALSFPGATLDGFGGIPVIGLGLPGIHGEQRLIKRAFDVIAVSLGLVLLSPFLLMIAILIRLDSPAR
jgi:FlaA1/EpsC-like NDP-sugar epimerase